MPKKSKAAVLETKTIDILEEDIKSLSPALLKILLKDMTTGKNIRWACDEYAERGPTYRAEKQILTRQITGRNTKVIQPRTGKSKEDQKNRTKKSAEVFTPSWICNEMNNHCDDVWFGRENVFNTAKGQTWTPNPNRIEFDDNPKKTWQKYVDSTRLEITCGEAPYLVSRYDTTTGEQLPISHRIGIIDRKLRVVNENTQNEADWFKWAKRAFESSYGFEYQGDNVLLARENLLWTFIENYRERFQNNPPISQIRAIAKVIAWNIWQMDGLNDTTPYSKPSDLEEQMSLFETKQDDTPLSTKIMDWRHRHPKEIFFKDLKKGAHNEV